MTWLTGAVALTAAVAFGWSAALMHHSAWDAPRDGGGTLALLNHLVRQPRWLAGMAASLTGLGLHALALHLGSLAVVQPLIVTGLIFSFVFRAALDRQLPSRGLMAWVLVTGLGLAVFLIAAGSTRSSQHLNGFGAGIFFPAGIVLAAVAWGCAHQAPPRRAGMLLGAAGGIVFGLIAGSLKATTDAASHGSLFTSWPLYTLLPLGVAGFLLNQQAYHRAPLSSSLPILNMLNPVVAIAFGAVVFHERPSEQVGVIVTAVIGLTAVLAGIFFLLREDGVAAEA